MAGPLAALAVAAACTGGGDSRPVSGTTLASTTTTIAPVPAYQPRFAQAPCVDEVPASDRIDCGWLTVPENRERPAGATVRLPVAIIRTDAAEPEPDPIVYFSGGPGFPGLTIAGRFLEHDYAGRRDVILFDQRGTGAAEPSLDCPETVGAVWANLGAADLADNELERSLAALDTCRDRLVAAGIDLDSYDTSATAADAADLRQALGIDEWNLFGVSYGTTVALVELREHPDGVRSVVLDSVYPTTVGAGGTALATAALRVLGVFYTGCAAAPGCAAAYPMLREAVDALAADFNDHPFETEVTDPDSGSPRHLAITGDDVVAGMWNAFYDSALIPVLPSLVQPLRERETAAQAIISELAAMGVDQLTGAAEGQTVAVDCADRQRLDTVSDLPATLAEHPELSSLFTLAPTAQACARWHIEPAPATFNAPVTSAVPALVLAGEYDPVTPPAQSRDAASHLTHSTFVELPGLGHGAVFANPCPASLFAAFVADPEATLDTACVTAMPPPAWVLPGP